MLRGQPRPFLTEASQALGMYACGDIGIDPNIAKQSKPLDDDGERLATGLAGWLPHPPEAA